MDDEGVVFKEWNDKAEKDGFKGFLKKGSTGILN
jgi:hypothetical protein